MNFFAHATLALWRTDEPRFVLGAMLPDLLSMLGMRLSQVADDQVAAGIAYHHATDNAFHHAPVFVELCDEGIGWLSESGVARGTARAIAHVGTELLLDGTLSHDLRARTAYTRALTHAIESTLLADLCLERSAAERLRLGVRRLVQAPIPEGYRDVAFVVARLRAILARRPRLAMREQDDAQATQLLRAYQPRIELQWPTLQDQLRSPLLAAASEQASHVSLR